MLTGIAGFIYFVLNGLLGFMQLVLFINGILSLLVSFNVINTRNPGIYRLMDVLDRLCAPIVAPFRALVPNMGGFDLSYLMAWLVIAGIRGFLLRPACVTLQQLMGG